MDRHTELINWICSTFDSDPSVGTLGRDCGYIEFRPEPEIRLKSNRPKTPDIVAINKRKKIVMIIEAKGGANPAMRNSSAGNALRFVPDLNSHEAQLKEYTNIDVSSLSKYFEEFDDTSDYEVVATCFCDSYSDFKDLENRLPKMPFWICDVDHRHIRKTSGKHLDSDLEIKVSKRPYIELSFSETPPHYIYFTRDTPKEKIVAEALTRLLLYCTGLEDYELDIEKIDEILMNKITPAPNSMKPMLWQFTKEERTKRWRQAIGVSIQNRWMKEVKQGKYRFIKPDSGLIDANLLDATLRVMLAQFREYAEGN